MTSHEGEQSPTTTSEPAADTPVRRRDFRRAPKSKLSGDAAKRQGDITTLAFRLLGGRDSAIAYLNTERTEVGGRPLAVATESREGWLAVEADLQGMTPNG